MGAHILGMSASRTAVATAATLQDAHVLAYRGAVQDVLGGKIPAAGRLGLCPRSPGICNLCYIRPVLRRGRTAALRAVTCATWSGGALPGSRSHRDT
jgi:hypothetical protein